LNLLGFFLVDESVNLPVINFSANTLFQIRTNVNASFPLNIEFKLKKVEEENRFKCPGIFSILYKGEIIYIGYSENNDDIRSSRWVRQLATITLRGDKVVFSKEALEILQNSNILPYINHLKPMVSNRDFQTSKNRVLFANYHWNEFVCLSEETLKHFEFQWFPIMKAKRKEVKQKCENLKNQYTPRCNKEYKFFTTKLI
jgi:hypothetical protein